ncbi:MAG: phosphoenolpyruvate hydrolase family protein [Roseococcus sp.]|nr:phosphoenolpyruvate hydrolase family protein [Roseococcus sp.]
MTLWPVASLDGLRPARRAQSIWLPALAPFPPHLWPLVALLPVLDINGALAAALEAQRPFRTAPPIAGIFACDPFLRPTDLAAGLHRVGIRAVVNAPTIQLFDGETAAELGSVGYRAEAEFRVLLRLAERGLEPIACVTSRAAADLALGLGLRRFLLHPGLTPPADPQAWWRELAGHVAIEGGEAMLWRETEQ